MVFNRWDECVQGANLDFVYISILFQELLHPQNKQNTHQSKNCFLSKNAVLKMVYNFAKDDRLLQIWAY